jgi:tetratricopeptide (TPR) repeat protein
MRLLSLALGALVVLCSCSQQNEQIVDNRYATFIKKSTDSTVQSELDFWQKKLDSSPENSVFLKKKAAILSQEFRKTNNIGSLLESTEILRDLNKRFPDDVAVLHALTKNSITRHAFSEASDYVEQAIDLGEKEYSSRLMLVDVLLENGEFAEARYVLENLGPRRGFDEQIRWVKLYDAEGDLDTAVETMELALQNAIDMNKTSLIVWSLSNLGDMYGHQGEVKKSYESYLRALEIDPTDSHSKKGIGWIAFSHDNDFGKAESIWKELRAQTNDPELDLLLADLAEMKNEESERQKYTDTFISRVGKKEYGNMYGSYLIGLMDGDKQDEGLALAKADLEQRSHPMTFCHYAEALHQAGRTDEAIEILNKHVLGFTEEPDAYFIAGTIFHDAQQVDQAGSLLKEALAASYELGPNATRDIRDRLNSI